MNKKLTAELIKLAHDLADVAREKTLEYFRNSKLDTENKDQEGFDPVTIADRAAEAAMRTLIESRRPGDSIIGEEYGEKKGSSGLTWVLDPIDGTRGYISGTPTWGTLISLNESGRSIFGIIDQPYIGERFTGGVGHASFKGPLGKRFLKTSQIKVLSEAIIFSTDPYSGSEVEIKGFNDISNMCRLTRFGMDCYAYGLLALGHIDLVVEVGLKPYDIQSPIAVVKAAGGYVTDWRGGHAEEGGRVLASSTHELHLSALNVLKYIN